MCSGFSESNEVRVCMGVNDCISCDLLLGSHHLQENKRDKE